MAEPLTVGDEPKPASTLPPSPGNEAERLDALYRLAILDTPSDPAFDRITRLASAVFGTPLALISFVDETRQWFKSAYGSEIAEMPRDLAFCAYTILQDEVMVVPDASQDPRFSTHPSVVGDPGVRFYAGAPIVTSQGHNVGSLCVLDTQPRPPLTPQEQTILSSLAYLARDAAEHHQNTLELQEKDEAVRSRYALVARPTLDGLWEWSLPGNRVFYSHRWQHIFGLPQQELTADLAHWTSRIHPADEPRVQAELHQHLHGLTPDFRSEHRVRHTDGAYRWVLARGTLQRTRSGRPVRMTGSLADITGEKTSDNVTGLPNRLFFCERLRTVILRSEAEQRWNFAVLSLQVDQMDRFNVRFGEQASETMLKAIALRLSEVVGQTRANAQSMVARLDKSEFVILLDGVQSSPQAQAIAQRMYTALSLPIDHGGEQLFISVSIGIAMAAPERRDPESYLQKADLAMYRSRANSRALAEVFDPETQEKTVARMELERDLRQAVALNQLCIEYQPQIDLRTGALVGCEALVRWQHPRLGRLMPADFIGIAEETGVISAIDLWVLERSCAQLTAWRQLPGASELKMSVNFSAQHLPQRGLKDSVLRLLRSHDLPAEALCLELTESILDEDVVARIGLMEELASIGVGLHMDDFGSGYSSFKQLYELPFDTLKIDRSFLDKILDDLKARKIVEGILGLTHLIGLKVVAEGIEDIRQAELLKQMGCDCGQGFLYDRALPADTFFTRHLQGHSGRTRTHRPVLAAMRSREVA